MPAANGTFPCSRNESVSTVVREEGRCDGDSILFSDFAGLAGVKELPTQSMAAENKIHTAASYQFCLIKIVVTAGFKRQKSHQLPSAPLSHTEVDHS